MRRVTGRQLTIAAVVSIVATLLALALSIAVDYFRNDWSNPVALGAVVVLASAAGILPLFKQDSRPSGPDGPVRPAWPPGQHGGPPNVGRARVPGPGPVTPVVPRRVGRVPIALAVVLILLCCGGGAAGVGYGAQYGIGLLTGRESGSDVLVSAVSGRAGGVEVEVTRVVLTPHFTRVDLTASNGGEQSASLPLYRNCHLSPDGGRTLEAHDFRSDWPDTVPAGESVNGTVVFDRLPDGVTSARLSFATVFAPGGGSLTVEGIRLSGA